MRARLHIKSEKSYTTYGGLYFILRDAKFREILRLADQMLGGEKRRGGGFAYSEVIKVLFCGILTGATCIEDTNSLRPEFEAQEGIKAMSADTVLRMFARLSGGVEEVSSGKPEESGEAKRYKFVRNGVLNDFLFKSLLLTSDYKAGQRVTFDYDNQIIGTEKWDAKRTYKEYPGYCNGIAFMDGMPCYIEGRDGNAPVKFDQARTLKEAFGRIKKEGLIVSEATMDAGSYSQECIKVVAENAERFYIRANNTTYVRSLVEDSTEGWRKVKIGKDQREHEVRSLDFDNFLEEEHYRLVVYRIKNRCRSEKEEKREALRGLSEEMEELNKASRYRFFCILTNDRAHTEEEIIEIYNRRGKVEKVFDQMNNDFNWSHLPSSFLENNVVFMILTAVLRNFYTYFVRNLARVTKGAIKATSRVKAFIFNFITCHTEWRYTPKRRLNLSFYNPKPALEQFVRRRQGQKILEPF